MKINPYDRLHPPYGMPKQGLDAWSANHSPCTNCHPAKMAWLQSRQESLKGSYNIIYTIMAYYAVYQYHTLYKRE